MFELVSRPTLPGELLWEEFMKPNALSIRALANHIDVSYSRIKEIIKGRRAITIDTAFRLAAYFNTTPEFWINAQNAVDMFDMLQNHQIDYQKIRTEHCFPEMALV